MSRVAFQLYFYVFALVAYHYFKGICFHAYHTLAAIQQYMVATDTCSQLLFNFIRTVRTSLFSFNVVVDVCGQCIGCSCSFQRFSRRNGIVPSVLDFKGQDDVFQCIVISVLNLDYLGFPFTSL